MPITFDENGLTIQTQDEIRDETFAELEAELGFPVHTDPTEDPIAGLVNVNAEIESVTQLALGALNRSIDPDGAIGRPLDARLGLTGTVRKAKTRSFVNGEIEFSGAATVAVGHRFKHDDTDTVWEVTNGPHVAVGAETIEDVQVTAVEAGPKIAAAGSTWSNVTIVAGVVGFTNPDESATPGRNIEADSAAKARRKTELYSQGKGPLAAIEGRVSRVDGVVSVRAYHNIDTVPEDADGIPFKAFNVVVETNPSTPTAEQEDAIREAIWSVIGAGGEAYGTDVTGEIVDSEGRPHTINFDLVSVINISMIVELKTSTSEKAVSPNIEDVVEAKLFELTQGTDDDDDPLNGSRESHQLPGRDVCAIDYSGEVARLRALGIISGVDAATVKLSIHPAAPTAVDKISIGIRERSAFDPERITATQV